MKVKLQSGLKHDKVRCPKLSISHAFLLSSVCDDLPPKNTMDTISKSLLLASGQAKSFSVKFAA